MSAPRVTPQEAARIVRLYETDGKGVAEVARIVRRHEDTVRRALERQGVTLRDNRAVNVDVDKVVHAYEHDMRSLRAIANQFGIGYGTAHRIITEHSQPRPRRPRRLV